VLISKYDKRLKATTGVLRGSRTHDENYVGVEYPSKSASG